MAISLRALAALVPLLGSEIVIGGKRSQYFVETKPKVSIEVDVDYGFNCIFTSFLSHQPM